MAFLDETGLTYLWKKIKLAPYPVGSIYMSVNSTSPASLFGGTWERLKDRFMLAAGDTYKAGSTGGEANHQLLVDELPNDTTRGDMLIYTTTDNGTRVGVITNPTYYVHMITAGKNIPHNNMPPYLAVYVWKRVA